MALRQPVRALEAWARRPQVTDAAAFVIFAAIGMLSHDGAVFATGFARDTLPLWIGWFGVAAAVGLYRAPSRGKLVLTWAVGIPLGVLIRGVVLGRHLDGSQLAFLIITMLFNGALILLLRRLARRRT